MLLGNNVALTSQQLGFDSWRRHVSMSSRERNCSLLRIIATFELCLPLSRFRGSIVVSISACHAEDPGSIPGRGAFYVNALLYPCVPTRHVVKRENRIRG